MCGFDRRCHVTGDTLEDSIERLRIADSCGIEWANMLQDRDTDPQMIRDVVRVVRAHLKLTDDQG